MSPTADNQIVVERLTKRFGSLLVLDNVNFTIHPHEFLCVVGPTGCGKTTFANILAKLIPSTSGQITKNGIPIDPHTHNISFVFQEPSCLPWLTVRGNVKIGLETKGIEKQEADKKLEEVIGIVGLKEFESFYSTQISGGMKQRVAIARAFATDPDLLLMDEPFGQLDEKTRFYLEDVLIKTWEKLKNTIVFVTHNLEEAVYLADRILILTQKPTHIKTEVKVDLPRARDYTDPKFVEIRKHVTEQVKWW